jgi:hypothetical protein
VQCMHDNRSCIFVESVEYLKEMILHLSSATEWSIDSADRQEVALYRGGLTVAAVGALAVAQLLHLPIMLNIKLGADAVAWLHRGSTPLTGCYNESCSTIPCDGHWPAASH